MDDAMGRLTPDEIEAHGAAIRALARRLVGDAHVAEDVAQDALVVALQADAPRGARLGPWLRGVGRHLALRAVRTAERRRRREESARAPAGDPAPDKLIARTELRHRVVAELLRLDEPYRRTLLLRFFEGLEPTEISRLDDVPAGTVRSRLKRGLELLRGRLDAVHDGRRAAWALPLAAGLRGPPAPVPRHLPSSLPSVVPSAATLTLGALVMSWKLAAAVLGIVALAGAAWFVTVDGGPSGPRDAAPGDEAAAADTHDVQRQRMTTPPADAAPAVVESPPTTEPVAADLWVVGRVLGDGRFPESGVLVALVTRFAEPVLCVTDADGRYRLPSVAVPDGADALAAGAMVHARAPDGRAAARSAVLSQAHDGTLEVPTLALGPAHALVVRVEDADGPVADAVVTLTVGGRLALERTGSDGVVRVAGVPEGDVVLQAFDPARGRAHERFFLGDDPQPHVLTLTRREVTVRTVRAGSGDPVADVPFDVWFDIRLPGITHRTDYDPPLEVSATGPDGIAVLSVGGDDRVTVTASAAASDTRAVMPSRFSASVRVRPGETSAVLELTAPHTYRWRLVPGDAPPPAEGDVLELLAFTNSGRPPPADTVVVQGAHLVIADVAVDAVNCYARTSDGRIARLLARAGDTAPQDASFRRERHIQVTVRNPDGSPAAGTWVVARDQGNNPMRPPVQTDADGVARIGRLYGLLADVDLIASPEIPWGGTRIGTVDLDAGDGTLEMTLPERRRVALLVTCDGTPALPTDFTLTGAVSVVDEDPATGRLDVEYATPASGAAVRAWLRARGFQAIALEFPAAGTELPIEVALCAGAAVRGSVRPPPDGRATATVERRDPANGHWSAVNVAGSRVGGRSRLDGAFVGRDLAPGRYRIRDTSTGLATIPVDVAAGRTADLGELDLSASGAVKGTVEVPPGSTAAGARVVVESEGLEPLAAFGFDNRAGAVRADGRFDVRVPGDRVVRLRVEHATLQTGAGGVVEVREPTEGVVLRLERGPVVRVRAQEAIRQHFGRPPSALFFVGEPRGEPVFTRTCALADGGGLEFGAPPPGRYTLWIDAAPWAPLVVRDVQVGSDDLDLGEREFPVGSAVRVRVLVAEGQAAPRLAVWCIAAGLPSYTRGLNSNGETEVLLRGLGAGRFSVTCRPVMGTPQAVPLYEIDVDGAPATIHDIEMDLR